MRAVIVRDRVPAVAQGLAKPPQAPQAPVVAVPQVVPSVSRLQGSDSLPVSTVHTPSVQRGVWTDREREPVSPQGSVNPWQLSQAP